MKKPVAFIIFNRPDTTVIVFEKIRKYQPDQLFIIADGPRLHKKNEKQLCDEAKKVIQVDWDCEVIQIYSDTNLGCQKRISSGLDEVFEHVEEAIILEDDCVPHMDFFTYCEDLLDYYKDEENIMAISGDNFKERDEQLEADYYFTNYFICWGWATWKRAWKKFDITMNKWNDENMFIEKFPDAIEREYWKNIYNNTIIKSVDSWYYPWLFSIWKSGGYSIAPRVNLVSNIGFGNNSTHTKKKYVLGDSMKTYPLSRPLKHINFKYNFENDRFVVDEFYGIRILKERYVIGFKKSQLIELLFLKKIEIKFSNILIFGTGNLGRIIEKSLSKYNVLGFIDNDETKQKVLINELPVFSVNSMDSIDFQTIIVTIEGNHDIVIVQELKDKYPNKSIISWKDLLQS